ncbi:MerR family transcriptional regulator [Angustibacter sp. McL0619]|uniref:MerR family transcriptional regulator n=1 Tax=Angustibacter sp. McL0619 TaxID=3415676 RepID=UPI003CEBE691
MKIGELAQRSEVAPRLIRYYEQQGLLAPPRSDNGYRSYSEDHVERVSRVASLVQAGLPTRLVKVLLDAEEAAARNEETCPVAVAEQLAEELHGLESRIACLSKSRDTIRDYLARTQHEVLLREAAKPTQQRSAEA